MKKKLVMSGIIVAVVLAALAVPVGALAKAKLASFDAHGAVVVTGIASMEPAGKSGRVRTTGESLATITGLVSDWSPMNGAILLLTQNSNELFDGDPTEGAPAVSGQSKGTFKVIGLGGTIEGQYQLQVSNSPGCQIHDEGTWSTTSNSGTGDFQDNDGSGTVEACLNYVPEMGTFVGSIDIHH